MMRLLILLLATGSFLTSTALAQKSGNRPTPPRQKPRLPDSSRATSSSPFEVAPLIESRGQAQTLARDIDRVILTELQDNQTRPAPRASDATFVRRIYLDLAGRIPTADETGAFLQSEDPEKRAQLIDKLLISPEYVSHFYNLWADVLRLSERPEPNILAEPYLAYVKEAIRTNRPYDQWVYEMLTADGKVWDNPAAGYQLRDNGMPLPYVDNTVRVFLGTQIGCAQCHDHPFDDWTQRQFYELAAFTAGTRTRLNRNDFGGKANPARDLIQQARNRLPKPEFGPAQRLVRANSYAVSDSERRLRLPHDYAYANGEPKQLVQPAVLWGEVPAHALQKSRREQFAAWVTSPSNPQFSRMIANRIWHRLTGVGVVEPIDDFRPANPPFSEALLDTLAQAVVSNGFDLRELIRGIVNSESYQRDAVVVDRSQWENFVYRGPALRRMTAEQVWDSILTLTVYNAWPFQRPAPDALRDIVDFDLGDANFATLAQQSSRFRQTYFLNSYKRQLNRKHGYRGLLLCKASELPTPLPAGHFLRQFGQSDRESIQAGNTAATVPQILTMFNGPITHSMLETGSRMYDSVAKCETPREAIDLIFLSVLSRPPTAEDRRIAVSEIMRAKTKPIGYGNVIWALLNTREFLFVR